ncbi:MAG: transposase [Chloroflexota bacterium]|nr:transposase [Chloroflexota bacterium]
MNSIAIDEVLAKLPAAELEQSLQRFLAPMIAVVPDRRLQRVLPLAVRGILARESPVITQMAQSVARTDTAPWPAAKRLYRFLDNSRIPVRRLFKGLYQRARVTVAQEQPPYVVVAVDPVNFEKPYTHALAGVSTVRKSTPPDRHGKARLTRGYPAITATIVNTRVPAITYANWFSYCVGFRSENWEIKRALRMTRAVLPTHHLRFVGDAGLDDQKIFQWITELRSEFVIRACHLERIVEVANPRLNRWESEHLQDLVDTVPFATTWAVTFTHAGATRQATVKVGWLPIRLPETQQELWAVVAEEYDVEDHAVRTLVLLTNVPITGEAKAQAVYEDWRLRGRIEHGYRFDQEQGLDVEDMRVQTLARMQRLFALVLIAAQFVFHLMTTWPPQAVLWLRKLGGKLEVAMDRDGPYLVLRGLHALWQTVATLSLLAIEPFPHDAFETT